jgi:uncharacterized protein (DUF302 family)
MERGDKRMTSYGFSKTVDMPYEKAVEKATEELKKEGFGVLTTIDVKEKFKEKLGIDFKKYVILGACNPPFAHQALQVEEDIGLLLPCNVVVYERDGKSGVAFIKPTIAMGMIDNSELRKIAEEVEKKLKRVFDTL